MSFPGQSRIPNGQFRPDFDISSFKVGFDTGLAGPMSFIALSMIDSLDIVSTSERRRPPPASSRRGYQRTATFFPGRVQKHGVVSPVGCTTIQDHACNQDGVKVGP